MNIKELSYFLFAVNYRLGALLPVRKNFVFSIMTHDSSESGNVRALTRYMSKKDEYEFYYITKGDRKDFFNLIFVMPFLMARASVILMDNAFMPMSFFRVRKESRVLQLWHGTGSVKRFGQHSNVGRLKELEKRINKNIDFLFVNADCLVEEYAEAFGISEERVFATGLPRTDWLLKLANDADKAERLKEIRTKIASAKDMELSNSFIILYAPTFRDDELSEPKLHIDIEELISNLPENVVIFLRLHPFVSEAFKADRQDRRIVNVSDYEDLNELMAVSDVLITDYSSLVFDYVVFDRPMYFLADDIDRFTKEGRGFYLDYKRELPGLVSASSKEVAEDIVAVWEGKEPLETALKRREFKNKYYKFTDGKSVERVYEVALGDMSRLK